MTNKSLSIGLGLVIILSLGAGLLLANLPGEEEKDTAQPTTPTSSRTQDETPLSTPVENEEDLVEPTEESTADRYVPFSETIFEANSDKRRVYFFHATWCPTCKAANTAFEANLADIPADVVVLKTDYDTERALKQKFGVTYQHTFVQVDESGELVTKWNGGDITELLNNIV